MAPPTAPEVFSAEGYGLAADVYSFGVLMWEACCKSAAAAVNPLAGLEPSLAVQQVHIHSAFSSLFIWMF